jgi:hypothetical protein
MPITTRDLLRFKNSGHSRINSLFSEAHSMSWDIDRDVDWSLDIKKDDPCVDPPWAPFGRTKTFQTLPSRVQRRVARHALGRVLNNLRVTESMAVHVCSKLAIISGEEDHRNHAVAQAMDEARHQLAFVRFMEKMGDEFEDIDPYTAEMLDGILAIEDKTSLVANVQFFLEAMGLSFLDSLAKNATHPLLKRIVSLNARDESRHATFGVLYVSEFLRTATADQRYAFGRHWISRILNVFKDPYVSHIVELMTKWLDEAGVQNPDGVVERMQQEQRLITDKDRKEMVAGLRVHLLLSAALRAGLLAPDILAALDLQDHPLILGAVNAKAS